MPRYELFHGITAEDRADFNRRLAEALEVGGGVAEPVETLPERYDVPTQEKVVDQGESN